MSDSDNMTTLGLWLVSFQNSATECIVGNFKTHGFFQKVLEAEMCTIFLEQFPRIFLPTTCPEKQCLHQQNCFELLSLLDQGRVGSVIDHILMSLELVFSLKQKAAVICFDKMASCWKASLIVSVVCI